MGERDSFSNKILRFFFTIFLILSFGAIIYYVIANPPNFSEEKVLETREITPLMYEVTKNGSDNKIYLFGSMHKVKLGEFDFPAYVTGAYEQSDYLACEADVVTYLEKATVSEQYKLVIYSDGTKLKDHLNETTYNELIDYLNKNKIYKDDYESYNAYSMQNIIYQRILTKAGFTGDGVDEYFIKKARKDKKNILEVESMEIQNKLLYGFDDRLYELNIIGLLTTSEEDEIDNLNKLYSNWKKGVSITNYDSSDIKLNNLNDDDIKKYNINKEEDQKIIDDYNKKILYDRNEYMADKLIEYFESDKKVFFMVGAAHLPGNKGIATILSRKGYTVKIVK